MNDHNIRSVTTKRQLEQALCKLLRDQSFNEITVAQLLTTAHVSRGTFYRYYADKYELLATYEDHLTGAIASIFTSFMKPDVTQLTTKRSNDAFYAMLIYLYAHRQEVAVLIQCPASQLETKVRQLVLETVNIVPAESSTRHNLLPTIPSGLAQALVVDNILTALTYWLTQTPVLPPTLEYRIFVQTRALAPTELVNYIRPDLPVGGEQHGKTTV
ncbi:TetR/AcrR family transcriptional regulator [Lactiplantibacillus fabifermentans]|uniref:HTH tetR-type domain-containing protein n=2 Tax=Lactiplantibacillus fabifermentans TaxID=483011 RepID=A0A0R2NMI4_9LACO|nr:TetR/AcrR family transcriptional regulator [Lactiplantibacillus fabifermentans]ETY74743.1 hypothetical protein LFAB_05605 [Lactiplantibacillus fabifermentans T30PCM01]KRO26916.1 hypothetical protein DY78_GL000482 [Lactiplantibacillus fabifermentans DSM 21115]